LICDKLNHWGTFILESNYKIYHLIFVEMSTVNEITTDM
jgi:hypothetical protein